MKDAARNAVLGAIRHHLRAARAEGLLPPDRDALPPAPSAPAIPDLEGRVATFTARLQAVGGGVRRVPDARAATGAVAQILARHRASRIAFSDLALHHSLDAQLAPGSQRIDPADRAALFTADAGVTCAQHAIAETGSLVLVSSAERHRLASLVPPLHVAVVASAAIVDTLAAALAAAHATGPAPTITIVTGPSRTADIELMLVVGVHGPRHLEVVLVDDCW